MQPFTTIVLMSFQVKNIARWMEKMLATVWVVFADITVLLILFLFL